MALMKNMTIVRRTIIWLAAISTVWFVVLAFVVFEVKERVRQDGLIAIQNALQDKTEAIERYVAAQHTSLNDLAYLFDFAALHDPIFNRSFWDNPPHDLDKNMAVFAKENGFYDIFLITTKGDIVYSVKQENDLHTNLYSGPYKESELARVFKNALNDGSSYISDFHYYPPSNDYAAFMAKPIVVNGKIVGIAAVQIDNRSIHSVINDYRKLGETGEVVATVFREGQWIAMAPARHSGFKAYQVMQEPTCFPIDEVFQGHRGQCYAQNRSKESVAVAWAYIKELRWVIAVSIHEQELLSDWYKLMTSLIVLFFNGVFIIGFMVVMAFRSFSGPIQELSHKAELISEGAYDIEIDASKYDHEWQVLIRGFKNMSHEIKRKIALLNEQYALLTVQKNEIEALNQNLEERIAVKAETLQKYIDIVDQYVITSQTDAAGIITHVSEAFCKVTGYSKEQLIGQNHRIVRHPDMSDDVFADLWRTITAGKVWKGEIKNRKSDGGHYWVDTTIFPNIENGEITGYTAIRYDITNQKIIEEMAITDPMTGLYNRRHYVKTVQEEINRAKRHRYTLAFMMIDVDNFKLYNDTYGHQAGDEVLNRVAEILKNYTSRGGECSFRLGGEEFAVLVGNLRTSEYVELAERIRKDVEALKIEHVNNNAASYVTISIGIALWNPEAAITYEELYKRADMQLYLAKEKGRNRISIFTE